MRRPIAILVLMLYASFAPLCFSDIGPVLSHGAHPAHVIEGSMQPSMAMHSGGSHRHDITEHEGMYSVMTSAEPVAGVVLALLLSWAFLSALLVPVSLSRTKDVTRSRRDRHRSLSLRSRLASLFGLRRWNALLVDSPTPAYALA